MGTPRLVGCWLVFLRFPSGPVCMVRSDRRSLSLGLRFTCQVMLPEDVPHSFLTVTSAQPFLSLPRTPPANSAGSVGAAEEVQGQSHGGAAVLWPAGTFKGTWRSRCGQELGLGGVYGTGCTGRALHTGMGTARLGGKGTGCSPILAPNSSGPQARQSAQGPPRLGNSQSGEATG